MGKIEVGGRDFTVVDIREGNDAGRILIPPGYGLPEKCVSGLCPLAPVCSQTLGGKGEHVARISKEDGLVENIKDVEAMAICVCRIHFGLIRNIFLYLAERIFPEYLLPQDS